jgi:hypothetical protein
LRENIVQQARSIKGLVVGTAIAGIVIETGPTTAWRTAGFRFSAGAD